MSDEEVRCKFCWDTGLTQTFLSPCACTGSMKFVHKECLKAWLYQKEKVQNCEVCKTPILFQLPLHEDITCAIVCVWVYIVGILFVPFFHVYYFNSMSSLDTMA